MSRSSAVIAYLNLYIASNKLINNSLVLLQSNQSARWTYNQKANRLRPALNIRPWLVSYPLNAWPKYPVLSSIILYYRPGTLHGWTVNTWLQHLLNGKLKPLTSKTRAIDPHLMWPFLDLHSQSYINIYLTHFLPLMSVTVVSSPERCFNMSCIEPGANFSNHINSRSVQPARLSSEQLWSDLKFAFSADSRGVKIDCIIFESVTIL